MAQIALFQVYSFRNDKQNKVATSSRKWRKKCILEFWKLWKTPVEGECCSGTPRRDNEAFTMASSYFQVGLETVQTSNWLNFCEFKLRSCRIKNAPRRRPLWKKSLSRCGRTPRHLTFNCFTKAYQGAWKLKLMPRKVTQSRNRILQMINALIDEKLNCIVSCPYTF